jgi:hypothetical protein
MKVASISAASIPELIPSGSIEMVWALAEFSVNVGFAPNQIEVGELAAGMTEMAPGTSQEVEEKMLVGTIEITSDPGECNVKIGRRRILKNTRS